MPRFAISGAIAASFFMASAPAALADLTAADVWSNWQDYMASAGYVVTGTEAQAGDTLTVTDLVMTTTSPDGDFTIRMDQLAFVETGDATVTVVMPGSFAMQMLARDAGEELFRADMSFDQSGHVMTASGAPEDIVYRYDADRIGVMLTGATVDGEPLGRDAARAEVEVTDLQSTTALRGAGTLDYQQQMTMGALRYDMAFDVPAEDTVFTATGQLNTLSFNGDATLPQSVDTADVAAMIAAGFAFDGTFSFAGGQTDIASAAEGQQVDMQSSSDSGTIRVAMGADSLSYDILQTGQDLTIKLADLPFPLELSMAETRFNIALPVTASDATQDFGVSLRLGGFSMSDAIWGMFDPQGALPRDPASLALDLSGKARLLVDFLDPDVAAQIEDADAPPAELEALNINDLLLDAAGAKLTGSGSFTFDGDRPGPVADMPAPTGALNLQLVGANGLLDTLISMGLVGQEEAMGARMMMGMLAVPGDAPDTLNSRIEINDQGHILANGQRIQ